MAISIMFSTRCVVSTWIASETINDIYQPLYYKIPEAAT